MRNLDGLIDLNYTPFPEKGKSMIKLIILETIKLLITIGILYYTFKYETFHFAEEDYEILSEAIDFNWGRYVRQLPENI